MKPLNQAERKKAFGNFLLLFIVTMAIIIAVVFFSLQVPFAENKKMKAQIDNYQKQQAFEVQFSAQMTDPQILSNKLGSSKSDSIELLNNQINDKLSQLEKFKSSDSLANNNDNIYTKVLSVLYALQTSNYSLAKTMMQSQNQNDLSQENQKLRQNINDANDYIRQISIDFHVQPPYRSF